MEKVMKTGEIMTREEIIERLKITISHLEDEIATWKEVYIKELNNSKDERFKETLEESIRAFENILKECERDLQGFTDPRDENKT